MAVVVDRRYSYLIHPFHAVMLAGLIPWFLGALLSDVAYARTFEIQWSNFASWFLVGGLLSGAVTLICAAAELFRRSWRAAGGVLYFVVLLLIWAVALAGALMHARDAWGMMPAGLVLSGVSFLLACLAAWLGFRSPRREVAQ